MALAAMGRGVWEGDTPPFPRDRLKRPGTPLGTWPFLWGPSLGMLLSQSRQGPVLRGQTDRVSSLGSISVGKRQGESSFSPPAIGELPLKRRRACILGNFDLSDSWFHVSGA